MGGGKASEFLLILLIVQSGQVNDIFVSCVHFFFPTVKLLRKLWKELKLLLSHAC